MTLYLLVILYLLVQPFGSRRKRATAMCLFGSALIGFAGCAGGSSAAALAGSVPEKGPVAKTVPIAGTVGAVVGLFPDGKAYYRPDRSNLGGGGSTMPA